MTEKEAQRLNGIRESAERKIDEVQALLDRLNDNAREADNEAKRNINSWQTWLGAITFSLAAISGVSLSGHSDHNIFALIATLVFLITGVWITASTKQRFEQSVINATSKIDEHRPYLNAQKEIAWQIYHDPTKLDEFSAKLNSAMTRSIEHGLEQLDEDIKELSKDKVTYATDIWLGLTLSGIYLLLIQPGKNIYESAGLPPELEVACFIVPWLVLIVISVTAALKSGKLVHESNRRRLEDLEKEKKDYEKYLSTLKEN